MSPVPFEGAVQVKSICVLSLLLVCVTPLSAGICYGQVYITSACEYKTCRSTSVIEAQL